MKRILAFDLGAESGRAVVGLFDGGRVTLDVAHRFPNGPVRVHQRVYWDALRLFEDMKTGLRQAAAKHGAPDSLGVDAWGVDFALLGRGDELLGNPRHYRDPHTEGVMDDAFTHMPREALFDHTGVQFMRFNSLYQLIALQRDRSPALEHARSLLFIPDLFHFWLTGVKVNEVTIASTSQLYDPLERGWSHPVLDRFKLNKHLLQDLVPPGTRLGPLTAAVAAEAGVEPVPVVAPASHDTAAAVAAVPVEGDSWCYISSGTWSLMGVEVPAPVVTEQALAANFTNEGGVAGTTRLLKNVMGLWLVQECRRTWERAGRPYGYEELARLAEAAPPLVSIIDPDDASFWLPANMPAAIAEFCRNSGQPVPTEPGAVVRCALESLALRYRWVLERLEGLVGRRIDVIHIVGGGSQNALLNQLTADCCDRPVLAGPVEATALGNVLTQALGLGLVGSPAEVREVVRRSSALQRFEPREPGRWAEAYDRFGRLLSAG
jgi:rhamnulokinase